MVVVGLWVFNAFKNISIISRLSVLLVEETGVPGKTTTCRKSLTKFYHIMLYRVYLTMSGVQTHNFSGDRH